jgi:hypothetical protein
MSIMKRVYVHDIAAIALLIAAANLAAAQLFCRAGRSP